MADDTTRRGIQYPSAPADGRIKTAIVPAIADIYAPTLAELEAGVDISCAITLGGFTFSPSQATITDQRECTDQDFDRPGRKSTGDKSIQIIDNTNTEYEKDWNYAVTSLEEGTAGFIVRRRGLPASTPWANGQKVTVIPFVAGEKQAVAQDENTVQRSTVPFFVTGAWTVDGGVIGGNIVAVKSIALTPATAEVKVGEDVELTVTFTPADADDQTYTVTSSDDTIATATIKDGAPSTVTVHGVKDATDPVTIKVTSTDGAKTATARVTVVPKA